MIELKSEKIGHFGRLKVAKNSDSAASPAGRRDPMHSISNHAPTSVAAIDEPDPNAGGACHVYGVQYGAPGDALRVQFQHGPRGAAGSTPGIFDDDLLAIAEDRLVGFQGGPYACAENQAALEAVRAARVALSERVARRMAQGVLGVNATHKAPA